MGKFLRNITFFALPFVILLIWLHGDSPERAYSYKMIQKDCRTGSWIYRRLYESDATLDVAFLGTSKTMCDVNDSILELKLKSDYGKVVHISNFGVCRLGENLHYLIARDIFANKKPRHLIVELSSDIPPNSHFHFPYLAEAVDVFGAPVWGNTDYLGDIIDFSWNRLVYQRAQMLGIEHHFEDFLVNATHSFMTVKREVVADSAEMARIKEKRQKDQNFSLPTGIEGVSYRAKVSPAKFYFKQIAALCLDNEAKLTFLYIPTYGSPHKIPRELAFFQEMGEVWIPPDSIFANPKLHFDNSHLNMRGALRLSDWLAQQVAALD